MLIFFTSRHYSFFEKLKIVEKQLCKLICSYGKVSHPLKLPSSSFSLRGCPFVKVYEIELIFVCN